MSLPGFSAGKASFAQDVLDATRAVDAVFAEAFVFLPMKRQADVNAPETSDPSRVSLVVNAVLIDPEAKPLEPNAYDIREHLRPSADAGEARLEISPHERARLNALLGKPFSAGPSDRFNRACDNAVFRVMSSFVTVNGHARLKVSLAS